MYINSLRMHIYIYIYIFIYILDISSGRKDHFISKFIGGSITTSFVFGHSSDAGGRIHKYKYIIYVNAELSPTWHSDPRKWSSA